MASYELYCAGRSYGYPYIAKDKGDISNRAKCAYEQVKNKAVYTVKAGSVAAGATAAGYAALKYPSLASKLSTVATKVLKLGGNVLKSLVGPNNKIYAKAAEVVKNLPPKAKAIGLIALPAIATITYLGNKMIYKAGQIDQKYTDKAQMEERLKDAMINF